MKEDLATIHHAINSISETIDVVQHELNKVATKLATIRAATCHVQSEVINPLNAPEVEGADRDGEGGIVLDE